MKIGDIVDYMITEQDAARISTMRTAVTRSFNLGNHIFAGDVYPMLIVRVFDNDTVNGQVFLDGSAVSTLWVQNVKLPVLTA